MPSASPVYDALAPRNAHRLADLGMRLREARQRRQWTQKQLAEKAGFSLGTVKKLEAGDPRIPFGFWLQTMDVFAMAHEVDELALPENDRVGAALEEKPLRKRVRPKSAPVEFDLGED